VRPCCCANELNYCGVGEVDDDDDDDGDDDDDDDVHVRNYGINKWKLTEVFVT
jgi:hypothetical protein